LENFRLKKNWIGTKFELEIFGNCWSKKIVEKFWLEKNIVQKKICWFEIKFGWKKILVGRKKNILGKCCLEK
jgi:hypothetical protein